MKTINIYISKARAAKSAERLVSPDVLRSIVENSAATHTVQTSPGDAQLLSQPLATKGMYMASIMAMILAAGAWWLAYPQVPSAQKQAVVSPSLITTPPASTAATTATKPSPTVSSESNKGKTAPHMMPTLSPKTPVPTEPAEKEQVDIPLVRLNETELAALGIEKTSTGYSLIIEERFGSMPNPPQLISKNNYDVRNSRGIIRGRVTLAGRSVSEPDIIPYNGSWDISQPLENTPCAVVIYSNYKDGSTKSSTSSFVSRRHPSFDDNIMAEIRRELTQLSKDIDQRYNEDYRAMTALPTAQRNYTYLRYLLPVVLNAETDSTTSVIVLAYPLRSILPKLPPNILMSLSTTHPALLHHSVTYTYSGKSDAIEPAKNVVAKKIAGIEYLELHREELARLGVRVTDEGIECMTESAIDKKDLILQSVVRQARPLSKEMIQNKIQVQQKSIRNILSLLAAEQYDTSASIILYRQRHALMFAKTPEPAYLPYTGWDYTTPLSLVPVGYSVAHCWYSYNEKQEEYERNIDFYSRVVENSPLLAHRGKELFVRNEGGVGMGTGIAIPVQIELGSLKDSKPNSVYPNEGADTTQYKKIVVQLWFVPTKEFVAALPERYRLPLSKELQLFERVIKGELVAEQACEELGEQKSYLDMCRSSSGMIRSMSLAPNPATLSTLCRFTLREESTCSIAIYSESGQLLKEITPSGTIAKGANEIPLSLEGLHAGLYIVSVTTAKGEQVAQRMIIR